MANRFSEYVSKAQQCMPALPLTHTCDAFSFRAIATACQISIAHCEFFGESLAYFFYGRPAYRPRSWKKETAESVLPFMPCSIVLKPDAIKAPKRIAPFDTGAWKELLLEPYMHPEMSRDDFLLNPSMDMPPRLVYRFFGSNYKYYFANPRSISIPPLEFEAQSYYELIKHRTTPSLDDRGSTIEIQSEQSLLLNGNNVLFVVLPKVFYSNQSIRQTIVKEWKAVAGLYEIHQGRLLEHMGNVYNEVSKFLSKEKYI